MSNKVSIVIITKDTKELLRGLLNSIKNDLSLQPYIGKIIIIDNASVDTTEEVIKENSPVVVYVKNERNMGFAYSADKGASLAEDEYILFLNSDTILMQGELEKMIRFMDSNANVAICGPQLVYSDMKLQRSFAAVPSLSAEFFPVGKNKGQRLKVKGYEPDLNVEQNPSSSVIHDSRFTIHDSKSDTMPHAAPTSLAFDVDSLIGAAILVRRETLKALNGFDERFFFFLEETDLCVRVCRAGYKVVFFPEAKVIHLQGKTVRKSWISGRIEYNISLQKFIKKHHTPVYYGIFIAVRFIKALFLVALFPLLFFGQRMRMKYVYYVRLISWFFRGCPDNAGLRPGKEGQRTAHSA
jgi:N-acetylglucosaminyl-diphospho-decaprenol L-rhamnosyltransferase